MREKRNRTGLVIASLIIVVFLLLSVVTYLLLIKPMYLKHVYSKQVEAYNVAQTDFLNSMLLQIQQQGFIQIPVGNETLFLTQFQPQQQPAQ